MAQRSPVPKFGNWESEENVPYTAYFEKARKDKTGGKMNPNGPQANENMFNNKPPFQALPSQMESSGAQKGQEDVRSKHEHHSSQEEGDLSRSTDSPLHHENAGLTTGTKALQTKHKLRDGGDQRRLIESPTRPDIRGGRVPTESPLHHHGSTSTTDYPRRAVHQTAGYAHRIENSPVHPNNQARVGDKSNGVSSPSWERKGSSEGSHGIAPLTPGRSRLKSVTRSNETEPDHGAAVPKFGDWDETNPSSAGYTHIFNRVREERQDGAGKVPVLPTAASHSDGQKQYGSESSKGCCCF